MQTLGLGAGGSVRRGMGVTKGKGATVARAVDAEPRTVGVGDRVEVGIEGIEPRFFVGAGVGFEFGDGTPPVGWVGSVSGTSRIIGLGVGSGFGMLMTYTVELTPTTMAAATPTAKRAMAVLTIASDCAMSTTLPGRR
jgi:hypothetical protein